MKGKARPEGYSPQDVAEILEAVNDAGATLVGGQAINVWSELLQRPDTPPWSEQRPFTSLDVDALGDRSNLLSLARRLEASGLAVEVTLAETVQEQRINTGILRVWPKTGRESKRPSEGLLVNLLSSPLGLSAPEVRALRIIMPFENVLVPLLHPVLCVESKAYNLNELEQDTPGLERQDRKHLILAIANCREYLAPLCENPGMLRWGQRIVDLAYHQLGLATLRHHHLDVLEGVPWERWTLSPTPEITAFATEKNKFHTERDERLRAEDELETWLASLKQSDRTKGPHRNSKGD